MTDKLDLTDVTFTIPVRYESKDRENNVRTVIKYLLHHLDTNIILWEDDKTAKTPSVLGPKILSKINYYFNKNNEYLFHRTRFLNEMAMMSDTPIIVNYDSDLIVERETFQRCAEMIRNEGYEYLVGYSRDINKTPQASHTKLLETFDPKTVKVLPKKMKATDGSPAWFLKEAFIRGGMENEKFMSWGYEDNERNRRFKQVGLKFGRPGRPLWHLEHARVSNNFNSNPKLQHNRRLYESVARETREECIERIKKFPWLDKYGVKQKVLDYWKNG